MRFVQWTVLHAQWQTSVLWKAAILTRSMKMNDEIKRIVELGEQLKELKKTLLEKEEAYKRAKSSYEHLANTILPMEMFSIGLDSMTLTSGGTIKRVSKFYCQPNKNDKDRKVMADWLRTIPDGTDLIKGTASVDVAFIDKLKSDGIPYDSSEKINTASMKAFLANKVSSGELDVDEIPDCIHFQEVSTVEIDV